ncbi:thiamine pyrophosphate-binding protein [Pusillimonas sp. DMV24BSW_D]|uniref:thiamine pyrophosphate-binding protein n=1 Tax=Neopusillimonas aestuarii TaxID=2716226 RepID=UPI00140AD006|nr:thiamine pyrophosphate-binding protein [Pusillimonas sp. DMV24BSW_D]QIM48719.1 thiamine pyrophosphate-binding protein [Pusillimonas sp. DMV24BSW_D]
MTGTSISRTGARVLVDQLKVHGADKVFCVPGESYLSVLDAFHDVDSIQLVVTRHEAGACNMADAYGKLTGKPGICFVTRGPGATHASIGVHTAMQDSTPLILFIGQVQRSSFEKEAFQEIDYRQMFGAMAKWVVQIDDADRIPEFVARAFHTATSGRPGPVVIALPEDMLLDEVSVEDTPPYAVTQAYPSPNQLNQFETLLNQAQRPLVIAGGSTWTFEATQLLEQFAMRHHLPVCSAFRSQDYFDNNHPLYAGHVGLAINPKLAERVREADLLIVLGDRLSEATSGTYSLVTSPVPRQKLIHVHPDALEIGRVFQPTLGIVSGMMQCMEALVTLPASSAQGAWTEWAGKARQDYESHIFPGSISSGVDLAQAIIALREVLPDDAIVCNGAGNYTAWLHRYFKYRGYRTQLAPVNGAMGYGVPAAVAAKVVHPERVVVAVAGDGCFMMSAQELATARLYNLNPIFIVVNNGIFGTIRMHQERDYPGRVIGTTLANPDFVTLAESYGAYAERVETNEAFRPALERALKQSVASVIELVTDPNMISPSTTIQTLRGG